jgi:hypothetical protein
VAKAFFRSRCFDFADRSAFVANGDQAVANDIAAINHLSLPASLAPLRDPLGALRAVSAYELR